MYGLLRRSAGRSPRNDAVFIVVKPKLRPYSAMASSAPSRPAYLSRGTFRALFVLIILGGAALRIVDYPHIPPGFNQDEASSAYEAYCLALTGADRWGNVLPPYFPSWGSGQSVLLSYLSAPIVRWFGLSVFTARLVPLILGLLTVPLLGWGLRPLGRRTTLLGMLLIAIVPWHFMLSRWGLECNLVPFFMLLGCVFLSRGLISGKRRYILPSLLPFALALYCYGTTALVLPLMAGMLLVLHWQRFRQRGRMWLLALLPAALLALPFTIFFLENQVLGHNLAWTDRLPFSTPMLPATRLSQVSGGWLSTLRHNLAFFANGFDDHTPYNKMQGYPLLLLPTWPLAIMGICGAAYVLLRVRRAKGRPSSEQIVLSIYLCWALAALPLLALFVQNVNRFNHFYLPAIVLAAWAAERLISILAARVPGRLLWGCLLLWLLAEGGLAAGHYFRHYKEGEIREHFNAGLEEAFGAAKSLPVAQVHISSNMLLPYVYTLVFTQYPPRDFQREAVYTIHDGVYDVARFGRYVFHKDALTPGTPYGYLARKGDIPLDTHPAHRVVWTNDGWEVGVMEGMSK